MKINFKTIILSLAALAVLSCTPSAIDDLQGIYSAPTDLNLSSAQVASIDKMEGYRFITLKLSGQDEVIVKFASKDYYLTPTVYYNNPADGIKAGMYEEGVSTINGQAITFGSITVKCTPAGGDDFDYNIRGTVEVGENVRKTINYSGKLTFEADPEPALLKNVLSATSNVASGTMSVTLNLATKDVTSTYDASTWSTVYQGNGYYAAIDLYSEDGYLHEGTYKPCATGGAVNPGEYGIGWDPGDLWGIGISFSDWGTCWWTVDNGATSAEKITSGDIVVSKKGKKWTIEYNNYDQNKIWFLFEGAIEELTKPEGGEIKPDWYFLDNVSDVYDATYAVVPGVKGHTIYLGTDKESLYGGAVAASFQLILADGVSEIEGEYDVMEYASAPYKAGNGYSYPDWGLLGGSYYYKGADLVLINPGETISVSKLADGCYEISGNGYSFVAADDNFKGGGSVEPDYIELVTLLSFQSNVSSGTNSVTINMASEGVTSEYDSATWSTVYKGSGFYLATDIYSADGTLAEGTYTACATGGVINAGEFGIGWDPGDLWGIGISFSDWGTCWWTVTDGVTSAQKLTTGTITVTKDGDNYTIIFDNGELAARYIGPLTL